jgi:tripartite-type tricarboxylate transporter receptor subunit TctC
VIVEPRPGAATVVGTDHVAKSAPDGHTLMINSTQFVQSPATFAKLPYDPYTDIVPITRITVSPQAIVAHPSLPVKSIKELVAFAHARPGELNMGTAGTVLPSHYFFMLARVKMEIVPYKGAGLLDIGGNPSGEPPDEFATRVRTEIDRWKKVAAAAGIKPQ